VLFEEQHPDATIEVPAYALEASALLHLMAMKITLLLGGLLALVACSTPTVKQPVVPGEPVITEATPSERPPAQVQNQPSKAAPNTTSAATAWLMPNRMTPFSFLETMQQHPKAANELLSVVTMTDTFAENWPHKSDVDSLMKLISSQKKCACFVNPFSSYIPHDSANVGGYAIQLVKAYKQKQKVRFGLYACPKTNQQDVATLTDWWRKQD
jgi:hypothetical protein